MTSDYDIHTIVADPQNLITIYAGTLNGVFKRGLFAWTTMNNGLANHDVRKLLMNPSDSLTLYAATAGGVFKTFDGTNWASSSAGLLNTNVKDIALDPTNPSRLYAGTAAGVYDSVDSGGSWGYVGPEANPVIFVKHDPVTPLTVYAGIGTKLYRSTNGGSTWTPLKTFNYLLKTMTITPAAPSVLYVSTDGTVVRSEDNGQTWIETKNGMAEAALYSSDNILALTVDPLNQKSILAGTRGFGVYRLVDALFWDDFEDQDISDWSVSGGKGEAISKSLVLSTTKKAKAFSQGFTTCSTCTMETDLRIETAQEKLTLYGWYKDSKNFVQLDFDEAKNTIKLSQKLNGSKVFKAKVQVDVSPQIFYHLRLFFDGTNLHLEMDEKELVNQPTTIPAAGKIGIVVKSGTGTNTIARFDNLAVY